MPAKKKISIAISAYNEVDYVDELGHRLSAMFATLPNYEFEHGSVVREVSATKIAPRRR